MLGAVVPELLNVRSMPLATSAVLGQLTNDTVVRGQATFKSWWQIRFADSLGFISAHYLRPINDLSRLLGTVTATRLNVRSSPSLSGDYVATLEQGSAIKVLALLEGWLEIEFNGGAAFVAESFVELVYISESYYAEVTANKLNVRAAPASTARVLGQMAQGSRVLVEASYHGWSQFSFNGNRAFVANQYVKKQAESQQAPPITFAESDHVIVKKQVDEKLARLTPTTILTIAGAAQQRAVAGTWNRYGGLLTQLCVQKHIEPASAVAVLCVESSGKGFEQNNNNRMIIRFENHKFWHYWGKHNAPQYRQHFRYRDDKVWLGHEFRKDPSSEWQTFHSKQIAEWEVFEFARGLDEHAAILSISMGAPQIMGFHFERIGYQSTIEMFTAFASDIQHQIRGLFDFFSPAMLRYLKEKDFVNFAAMYNGSGQKQVYGKKIQQHYEAFIRIMPRTIE